MKYELIGDHIDEIRSARGWSKAELARRMESSDGLIQKHIRTGKMSLESLAKYAEVLGCTIGDLTDGAADLTVFNLRTDITGIYPYNLILDIFTGNVKEASAIDIDRMRRVYIPALEESIKDLTVREQHVLERRYIHAMTWDEIGKEHNVTRERVRQICHRALRKLRNPVRQRHWMMMPMDDVQMIIEERDQLRLRIITLKDRLKKNGIEEFSEEIPEEDVSIEEMNLSIRSYNCLKRAGILYLSDLKTKSVTDMYKVRNLGKRSLKEVITAMERYGAKLRNE